MDLASDCIAKADILADLSDERRAPCAALRTAASGTTSERRTGDACGKRANTGVARDVRIVDTYPIAFPKARAAEMDLQKVISEIFGFRKIINQSRVSRGRGE